MSMYDHVRTVYFYHSIIKKSLPKDSQKNSDSNAGSLKQNSLDHIRSHLSGATKAHQAIPTREVGPPHR